jgi:hypothetical protein
MLRIVATIIIIFPHIVDRQPRILREAEDYTYLRRRDPHAIFFVIGDYNGSLQAGIGSPQHGWLNGFTSVSYKGCSSKNNRLTQRKM